MAGFVEHLDFLVSSSGDVDGDKRVLDDWTRYWEKNESLRLSTEKLDQENLDLTDLEEPWESVLDLYRVVQTQSTSLISTILLKPNGALLLDSLRSALSSCRPDDDISNELVELLGFDNIELVMEILSNRATVVQELLDLTNTNTFNPSSSQKEQDTRVDDSSNSLAPENARKRMEKKFREHAARPLFSGIEQAAAEVLPHVYTSTTVAQGNVLSQFGSRYALPLGHTREDKEDYEEVMIPPPRPVAPRETERLIPISELDPLASGSFPGYSSLNRIQSIVYPTAYGSSENMLICAPTGAGKTDVAMLSILRVIDQHRSTTTSAPLSSTINRDAFKVIYVAPMKALASEIVRKLGRRLQWLSIRVRELTGDMQLTKSEIAETQIIVTTPEKWDVVTRKPSGEGELASRLKLLIIDEVHLLNEDRGAVIETIVARTLRQVESSQSVIRIVGLSATLPNYIDVADFLSVSRYKGLFYFDSSFRPIPLEQHFIGVKGKPGSLQSRKNLDRVTFQKAAELVAQGHQVMVFVHARRETVKTAMGLRESALAEGSLDDFSCDQHPQWSFFRKSIGESRNKDMKLLFDSGFGIHHAGMLRSDRNMMERMFEARAIKVLCCTATLAWGVNLPAHAVIIKGTQVYDSSKSGFVDLSVLDVLQVFGRAGRPGLETSGEGYICTTHDKLEHYLQAVTSQHPIESKFIGGMIDSLNAEISLGTVASTRDAVQWLGYTYLFVRMRKNPLIYGILRDATGDDPQLGNKRNELITAAARRLSEAKMIIFDEKSGALAITELGKIAAKYYIRHSSIEVFNNAFRPKMTEADVLVMVTKSTEFDQIQVRESEVKELKQMMDSKEIIPCAVKDGTDTSQGKVNILPQHKVDIRPQDRVDIRPQDKVNILLQGYISRHQVDDFTLVSDTAYAAQNGSRIIRAVLEIAISRKWASVTAVLMGLSKAVEKRLWPYHHYLSQFDLKPDILYALERWANDWSVKELSSLSAEELGKLVHMNEKHGTAILNSAKQFPSAQITYDLRPLSFDVLKIAVHVARDFMWNTKIHGSAEPFWVWVEDHDGLTILQLAHLIFRQSTDVLHVDFVISIPDGRPPPSVTIRFVSDRWMGAEDEISLPLESLVMPASSNSHTPRIDVPFLPLSVLCDPRTQRLFAGRLRNFNAMQTQIAWNLFQTNLHILVCAPNGSGKSLMAQILIWMTLQQSSDTWVLVITPRRSVVTEMGSELRLVARTTGVSIDYATSHTVLSSVTGKTIRLVTAMHWLEAISRRDTMAPFSTLRLVVCENLEQLDSAYELGVSLLKQATQSYPTRYVAFANSLSDPTDLAAWLDVDPRGLHSFRPSDRDQSLTSTTQTFTIPHSTSLFKAMAKPAHAAIQVAPVGESTIVFVPSRSQLRPVALDLITQCTLETETDRSYLPNGVSREHLEDYLARLQDHTLVDFVSLGVGFFHEGIQKQDRNLMLELYVEGIIRVLLVPRDSCWTLPVRAAVVVVMGTQYVHVEGEGSERQLRDYELPELVHMQSRAVRHSGTGHFYLFCQAEAQDTITRFLNDGLPLESQLLEMPDLAVWYRDQRRTGGIKDRQQGVEALSFTFLARRILTNPAYYDASAGSRDEKLSRIVDQLEQAVELEV